MKASIKSIVVGFLLLSSASELWATVSNNHLGTDKKRALFAKHFKILDSVVKANPQDTIYRCCKSSIDFMVKNTKLESYAEIISSIGRTSFTKTDLQRWRGWYDKRYGKRKNS